MKKKFMGIIIPLVLLMPLTAYANDEVIIAKGIWSVSEHHDEESENVHEEYDSNANENNNKMGSFIIYNDGEIKRGFFKFMNGDNWIIINPDKWTENGGMIMNNDGDMAMIVLEDGKGELHFHDGVHDEEYTFDYTITKIEL